MTGVTTGQTALPTATDADDTEHFLTVDLTTALQAVANLFESATGHDHTGSGKGKPIGSAGIASGIHLVGPVVDSGGLTVTAGGLTVTAGNVGIGIAPSSSYGLLMNGQITSVGTGDNAGMLVQPTTPSVGLNTMAGVSAKFATPASALASVTAGYAFYADNASKGAGSAITSAYGLFVRAQTQGGTNNYGVYIETPSGASSDNLGIYNAGKSRLDGGVAVGGANPAPATGLLIGGATPTAPAASIGLGVTTSGSATAGGVTIPTAATFWVVNIGGTTYKIPLCSN